LYDQNGKIWSLVEFLEKHCKDRIDINLFLGVRERVECRLIAKRVSDEVARIRRCRIIKEARKDGKKPTDNSLRLATFLVLCCNVPYELLSLDETFVLMRARWQIELLFKLWKDHGQIDEWRSEKPWRIICEVYAKLLAMLLQHWILLTGCWEYPDRSLFKAAKTIKRHAINIATAFSTGCEQRLYEALETIKRCLSVGCRINKSKTEPHTYQLLLAFNDSP
jgi:hypothetical protein